MYEFRRGFCTSVLSFPIATAGEDFVEIVNAVVVVQPGGEFPQIFVDIIDDTQAEFDAELVQYTLTTVMPRIDILQRASFFRIIDDDCESILCAVYRLHLHN